MLAVIKYDAMLSEYDAERLSKIYAEQIKRGVLVLSKGCSLAIIEEMPEIISGTTELVSEPEEETE